MDNIYDIEVIIMQNMVASPNHFWSYTAITLEARNQNVHSILEKIT